MMEPPFQHLRRYRLAAVGTGIAAALLLLVWSLLAPSPAIAAGWVIGFVFWLAIAVGALLLVAINALTGGRWATAAWPVVVPAAATIPAFVLFGLPMLFIMPRLNWPPAETPPDVVAHYLNQPAWVLRAAIALFGWSLLAFLLLRNDRPHRLTAAIGLCFHSAIVTLIGIDWILSLRTHFYSTAFAAALATMQILAALSWLAAARSAPAGGPGKAGDIGGLIIATALGSLYLGFCQYVVVWYGNIPDRVKWYVDRQQGGWFWIAAGSIVLSSAVPICVLMRERWRNDPAVLAVVGWCVLVGLYVYYIWLVGPDFGLLSIPAAVLGGLAIGGLWLALAYGLVAPRLDPARAV